MKKLFLLLVFFFSFTTAYAEHALDSHVIIKTGDIEQEEDGVLIIEGQLDEWVLESIKKERTNIRFNYEEAATVGAGKPKLENQSVTFSSIDISETKNSSGLYDFVAKKEGLAGDTYTVELILLVYRVVDRYTYVDNIPLTSRFNAEIFNKDSTINVELSPVIVNGSDATVDIRIEGIEIPSNNLYSVQLGTVVENKQSNTFQCVSSPDLTKPITLTNGGGSVLFVNLSEQTYCVSLVQTEQLDLPLPKKISCDIDPRKYSSFCDNIFNIGRGGGLNVTTISPLNDKYGCRWSGTEIYCPLQPLPGTVDPDTKGIDTRQGFGSFLNRLIVLFMGIIGVLSVLMIALGGIEYMTTIIPASKAAAKDRITRALLGLILALGSYAILNTINPDLVDINISLPGVTSTKSTITSSKNVQELAQEILNSRNISLGSDPDGDTISSARQNIEDVAAGKGAWTSKRSDVKQKEIELSEDMLFGLLRIASNHQIHVTFIAGGDHSDKSKHYQGGAFDIRANDKSTNELQRVKAILDVCKNFGASEVVGPCSTYPPKNSEGKWTTGSCSDTGHNTRGDHNNHIHCGWN